jgi:hypothetical protein
VQLFLNFFCFFKNKLTNPSKQFFFYLFSPQALFWTLLPLSVLIFITFLSWIHLQVKYLSDYFTEEMASLRKAYDDFKKIFIKDKKSKDKDKKTLKKSNTKQALEASPKSSPKRPAPPGDFDKNKIVPSPSDVDVSSPNLGTKAPPSEVKKKGKLTSKKLTERRMILRGLRARAMLGERIDLKTLPMDIDDIPDQPSSAAR